MAGWLKDAVFYEIYPQSFRDSNGDGIGDFGGICEKLNYISELGCNAIWMNPCFDSPFADAGYDVRDYKKTASRYGTNEDLYHLFEEVHKRGMHILLDLVAGHTSEKHEWFVESKKNANNPYAQRYIWTDSWFESPDGLKGVAGLAPRDGVYVVNFFQTQPALNYGFLHPDKPWKKGIDDPECIKTRDAIWDVMDFWIGRGCDGFRVDMADSLVKEDDEYKTGTCRVWNDLRSRMEKKYPEAVLVSEWNNPVASLNAGFHMDFMLDWGGNGYNYLLRDDKNPDVGPIFRKTSTRSITDFLKDYLPKYEKIKKIGKYCLITGNHDTTRVREYLDVDELKLAYAFLLTMPGAPFIYYGDEIGMKYIKNLPSKEGGYTRTGTRTPMQWNKGANRGFSSAPTEKLYLPTDKSADAPTVEDQLGVEGSLLEHVRTLLNIRHSYDDLKEDDNLEFLYARDYSRAFAYKRGNLLMLCNPDCEEQVIDTVSAGGMPEGVTQTVFKMGEASFEEGKVTLSKQSFIILHL